MSISQEELQKISEKLSKIPGDNSKLFGNIKDILAYMDNLKEVDTSWVVPTVSVVESEAYLREDELKNTAKTDPKDLLACSNQKVIANQVVLPNIMN